MASHHRSHHHRSHHREERYREHKPREERVKEFKKVKTKLGKFKVKDIKSDSPATAKAELKGSKNSIFVEVQMSPEKDNRIQKITFMKK